ncbi:hypothetical protein BDY21DRAFT_394269 [Lineolata rhizophorae]|uniref:DUF3669 domain-containing protein n=1 Tax=Lineolata rhizophorae TaxID=578093 RepID=A0A6A6NW60_9PEZI|nr:hypothetical protein BDY21DRAFT_394269 [Lineolata rhizophorae]
MYKTATKVTAPVAELTPTPSEPVLVWREIGAGACGIVYSEPVSTTTVTTPTKRSSCAALKLSRHSPHDLYHDYRCHVGIASSLQVSRATSREAATLLASLRLPSPLNFVHAGDNTWWAARSRNYELPFPLQERVRLEIGGSDHGDDSSIGSAAVGRSQRDGALPAVLISTRIPPLPQRAHAYLINAYCAPHLVDRAHADGTNGDALARVYLGRGRRYESRDGEGRQAPRRFFTLRNFGLSVAKLEDLLLKMNGVTKEGAADVVRHLATTMGAALAVMHSVAKLDARDVEFVLGGSSLGERAAVSMNDIAATAKSLASSQLNARSDPPGTASTALTQSGMAFYLLDFNQCRHIGRDNTAVDTAVDAFFVNDPYYPRPPCRSDSSTDGEYDEERKLWDAFVDGYLGLCSAMTHSEAGMWPGAKFIEQCERRLCHGS